MKIDSSFATSVVNFLFDTFVKTLPSSDKSTFCVSIKTVLILLVSKILFIFNNFYFFSSLCLRCFRLKAPLVFFFLFIILTFFFLYYLKKTIKAIKLIKFYHTNTEHDNVTLVTNTIRGSKRNKNIVSEPLNRTFRGFVPKQSFKKKFPLVYFKTEFRLKKVPLLYSRTEL